MSTTSGWRQWATASARSSSRSATSPRRRSSDLPAGVSLRAGSRHRSAGVESPDEGVDARSLRRRQPRAAGARPSKERRRCGTRCVRGADEAWAELVRELADFRVGDVDSLERTDRTGAGPAQGLRHRAREVGYSLRYRCQHVFGRNCPPDLGRIRA